MGTNSPYWGILFWVELLTCAAFSVLLIRTIRKYDVRKKQLQDDLNVVKDAQWFQDRMAEND